MRKKKMIEDLLAGYSVRHRTWLHPYYIYLNQGDNAVKDAYGIELNCGALLTYLSNAKMFERSIRIWKDQTEK